MTTVPLRHVAEVWTSSVDKHSHDDEIPIQLCNYVDAYRNDTVGPGPERMRATATLAEIERNHLLVGDTVLTKDSEDPSDIGISAYVRETSDDFVCGYHLAIARPRIGVHGRFLTWALRGQAALDHFGNYASGISRYGVSLTGLRSTPVPIADVEQQRRIADFLDDRTSRIDHVVAARRMQASLAVEAFRSSLEDRLWTRDSRFPLKHLLVDVTSGPRGWGEKVGNVGEAFVRIANLASLGIELRSDNLARVDVPEGAEAQRAQLRQGDVLLSITAVFGEVAVWRAGAGTFSQHVARLRPKSSADSDWIAWILQSSSVHDQYRVLAYGGTKVGMGLDQVRNLKVPSAGRRERSAIARGISHAWAVHEQGQAALVRSIDRLIEYKQSLITAAVNGELDVTTAGSGIPG